MDIEALTIINVGILIGNCLLVHNCLKIYTEVVKYKIFKDKKKDDVV
jgi:hypothetical protein